MGNKHLAQSKVYSSVNRSSLENTQELRNEIEAEQKKERVSKGNNYLASAGRANSRNVTKSGAKINTQTDDIDELQQQLRIKR